MDSMGRSTSPTGGGFKEPIKGSGPLRLFRFHCDVCPITHQASCLLDLAVRKNNTDVDDLFGSIKDIDKYSTISVLNFLIPYHKAAYFTKEQAETIRSLLLSKGVETSWAFEITGHSRMVLFKKQVLPGLPWVAS